MKRYCQSVLTLFVAFALYSMVARTSQAETGKPAVVPASTLLPQQLRTDSNISDGAVTLLRSAHVFGGIAAVDECTVPQRYQLSYSQGQRLADALDYLTSRTGKDRWEASDSVINILPITGVPQLLSVRIKEFDWDVTSPENGVIPRLLETSEISQAAAQLGFKPGPYLGGPGVACSQDGQLGRCNKGKDPVLRHEQNATLRDILNHIAADGHVIWSYHERHCGSDKRYSLDIVSR